MTNNSIFPICEILIVHGSRGMYGVISGDKFDCCIFCEALTSTNYIICRYILWKSYRQCLSCWQFSTHIWYSDQYLYMYPCYITCVLFIFVYFCSFLCYFLHLYLSILFLHFFNCKFIISLPNWLIHLIVSSLGF